MRRRDLLAGIAAGSLAGVAGCLGLTGGDRATTTGGPADADGSGSTPAAGDGTGQNGTADGATTTDRGTVEEVTLAETGLPATICEEEPSDDPGIHAVVDPAFDRDWSGYAVDAIYADEDGPGSEDGLADDHVVIGVERGGEAKAYSVAVLWYHEIVNDVVGGDPLIVTFCPLCNSGMVASRRIDGEATEFVVTGLLWQAPSLETAISQYDNATFAVTRGATAAEIRNHGNLVMLDRATGSYWSQILAKAICGPKRGTTLDIVPSSVATWGDWRREHPDTEVLLPPPHSGTTRPG